MSTQYVSVTTVFCDKCEAMADYVDHYDYDPQGTDWAAFVEDLEKEGWRIDEGEQPSDLCPKCNKEVSK